MEIWFSDPHSYIRELVEAGSNKVVWNRGSLSKRHIDPFKHAKLYFGEDAEFRELIISDQGTMEIDQDHDEDDPVAVYPTWIYGEDLELLEEMIQYPLGEDEDACNDSNLTVMERPVFGQEHRVIVAELPNMTTSSGKHFLRILRDLQDEYPDCIIHMHGLYGFQCIFGFGMASADFEPRTAAQKGQVIIPAGKYIYFERTVKCPQWINLLGFNTTDLKIPRNRCIYNIKSAMWAAENWNEAVRFKSRQGRFRDYGDPEEAIDTTSPKVRPLETRNHRSSLTVRPKEGDKTLCDICSINLTCKFFRVGSVCSVPGSEMSPLVTAFQSRNSSKIIDGLGAIVGAQVKRAERAIEDEEEFGEVDPEVTKLLSVIFNEGVQLAKLVDPSMRGGTKVAIGINTGGQAAAITALTPNQFVSKVISQYEAEGIPRSKITPQMIEQKIREHTSEDVIDGELVS